MTPFFGHFGTFLPNFAQIEATLRIRAYTGIFRGFPNSGNTLMKALRSDLFSKFRYIYSIWGTRVNPPPNKSNVATIVSDKFGSKALPLFGVAFIRFKKNRRESIAFIRVLPLLGKPRKILVYALIRSVASIWAKLGAEMYQKWPKKGVNFLFYFCAFGAKFFKMLPLFGCCLY